MPKVRGKCLHFLFFFHYVAVCFWDEFIRAEMSSRLEEYYGQVALKYLPDAYKTITPVRRTEIIGNMVAGRFLSCHAFYLTRFDNCHDTMFPGCEGGFVSGMVGDVLIIWYLTVRRSVACTEGLL